MNDKIDPLIFKLEPQAELHEPMAHLGQIIMETEPINESKPHVESSIVETVSQPIKKLGPIHAKIGPTFTDIKKTNTVGQLKNKYNALDKHKSAHIFEYGVIASKVILLITLLVVSFVNADTMFISEHPKDFLAEAITVGGTTALATGIIGAGRFASKEVVLNAIFIAFLIFFIFHILMEFSGMNAIPKEENTNMTDEEKAKQAKIAKNVKITSYVTGTVVSMIALMMIPLAIRVWDFKNFGVNKYATTKYLIEMASFGFLSGLPVYLIDKDRGSSTKEAWKHSIFIMGGFGVLYTGLQAGGFFSNIFGEMPGESKMYRFS